MQGQVEHESAVAASWGSRNLHGIDGASRIGLSSARPSVFITFLHRNDLTVTVTDGEVEALKATAAMVIGGIVGIGTRLGVGLSVPLITLAGRHMVVDRVAIVNRQR